MKVWVLEGLNNYEAGDVLGVFANEPTPEQIEAARQALSAKKGWECHFDEFYSREWEVTL